MSAIFGNTGLFLSTHSFIHGRPSNLKGAAFFIFARSLHLNNSQIKKESFMKRRILLGCFALLPFFLPAQAVITTVFDADLPGGLPKGVEIYLLDDVADLSSLGVGSANNGGGTDGVEFTFPAMAADSGTYFYVTSDSTSFADFFGFNADFTTNAMAINGDDGIELFWDSIGIDVFGDIDVDGSGQPWEYTDGWAARKALTGPDGLNFVLQNWFFSGVAALDMETTNGTAQNPVPLKTYTDTSMTGPDVTVILQHLLFIPRDITIEIGQTVRWTNVEDMEEHNVNGLQDVFPCNPQGFYSGDAALGPWDYDLTFNSAGVYDYHCDPHFSLGMIGSVTVVDPNAPDYPGYEISLVHSEDINGNADSIGTLCELQGVVHGPNFRPAGLQFTIIDVQSGTGINVFKTGSDCYEVTEGDLIAVKGAIAQFNGLTELIPQAQISVMSMGNALMQAQEIDVPINESLESTLVHLSGLTVDSIISTGASGWNLFGSNSQAVSYLVRLDADVFSDASSYEGQIVDVTGIVGQFDSEEPFTDGYQVVARGPQDIQIQVSVKTLPNSAITIVPNPARDVVRFNTTETIEEVRIYTTAGQLVAQYETDRQDLNISQLAPGEYVLTISTGNGFWSSTLMKF
jgi:plastocyanin